jgi:hypothetical protein
MECGESLLVLFSYASQRRESGLVAAGSIPFEGFDLDQSTLKE